ncbi:hypothetical protein H0H92_009786 [Tricholoma furcatifolium]|nr:hypothetical protein H0H92_009786 [Tricholoma furcatifolium]
MATNASVPQGLSPGIRALLNSFQSTRRSSRHHPSKHPEPGPSTACASVGRRRNMPQELITINRSTSGSIECRTQLRLDDPDETLAGAAISDDDDEEAVQVIEQAEIQSAMVTHAKPLKGKALADPEARMKPFRGRTLEIVGLPQRLTLAIILEENDKALQIITQAEFEASIEAHDKQFRGRTFKKETDAMMVDLGSHSRTVTSLLRSLEFDQWIPVFHDVGLKSHEHLLKLVKNVKDPKRMEELWTLLQSKKVPITVWWDFLEAVTRLA